LTNNKKNLIIHNIKNKIQYKEVKMLVLTRKKEGAILIGNDIKIKILRISKNQVRIGITAPPNIKILREELFAKDAKPVTSTFNQSN
jgi:carbon storage regulator CsrA